MSLLRCWVLSKRTRESCHLGRRSKDAVRLESYWFTAPIVAWFSCEVCRFLLSTSNSASFCFRLPISNFCCSNRWDLRFEMTTSINRVLSLSACEIIQAIWRSLQKESWTNAGLLSRICKYLYSNDGYSRHSDVRVVIIRNMRKRQILIGFIKINRNSRLNVRGSLMSIIPSILAAGFGMASVSDHPSWFAKLDCQS